MASSVSCPACKTPLSLFTPREASRHVNSCLDAQLEDRQPHHIQSNSARPENTEPSSAQPSNGEKESPEAFPSVPNCAICARDLSELTVAARAEHANRCLDNLNPRRSKKRARRQTTIAPLRQTSLPALEPEDTPLRRFLELLGLQRYLHKFSTEEIDLPALRLLEDSDFAQLRIPDAARRRIADALSAVPILAHIEGNQNNEPVPDAAVVPTQQFGTSRLAASMRRAAPMVQLDDSDFEYAPTPSAKEPIEIKSPHDACPSNVEKMKDDARPQISVQHGCPSSVGSGSDVPDYFGEIERAVLSNNPAPSSESSDVSSFCSDPGDMREVLRSASQITVELKLQKWKKRQVDKEDNRHKRELQRIEAQFIKLINGTENDAKETDSKAKSSSEESDYQLQNHDTIDLTEDMPDNQVLAEKSTPYPPITQDMDQGVVIASNDSVQKAAFSSQPENGREEPQDNPPHVEAPREVERGAPCLEGSSSRAETAPSEWRTPQRRKDATDTEEEVIDLISTEKKHRTDEPLRVGFLENDNAIPPLFGPSPVRDDAECQQMARSDSDDDFMDLLDTGKENTRSPSQRANQPGPSDEDIHKRSSKECDSISAEEEANTQSRLKKRPKKGKRVRASSQEIVQLIRADKDLYENILLMESVPFEDILSSVRAGCADGKHITKKDLHDLLQKQGVMFKGESAEPGSQNEAYMRLLNSDMCPD